MVDYCAHTATRRIAFADTTHLGRLAKAELITVPDDSPVYWVARGVPVRDRGMRV